MSALIRKRGRARGRDNASWLAQQRPLIGAQRAHLALVHRLPVALQDATGIPRIGIPRPVSIADPLRMQVRYQGPLPYTFKISTHRRSAELPNKQRRNAILL